jgi:hypothetical protein
MEKFGEQRIYENRQLVRNFVTVYELRITNTCFRKKDVLKYICGAAGLTSFTDYVVLNNEVASDVTDT